MTKPPKHPRLTPIRALALLRTVERHRDKCTDSQAQWCLEQVADALEHHIAAALVPRRGKR